MRMPSNYNVKVRHSFGYFLIPINTRVTEGYDYVDPFGFENFYFSI